MDKLGKWVTAGGGALVAVFSLIGWIVVATLETGPVGREISAGGKFAGILQGLLLMFLGAGIAAGAVLMYDACARCLGVAAGLVIFLSTTFVPSQIAAGGMNFWIILGGLVAVAGSCWDRWCAGVCREEEAPPVEPASRPGTPPPAQP